MHINCLQDKQETSAIKLTPMDYHFVKLEALIKSISLTDANAVDTTATELTRIQLFIKDQKESIRANIIQDTFEERDQKAMELMIDKYQTVLVRLMNELYQQQATATKKDNNIKAIRKLLHDHLNDLLSFLKTHYSRFFNYDSPIPISQREKLIKVCNPTIEAIQLNFEKRMPKEKLCSYIFHALDKLLSKQDISHKQSSYVKTLLTWMEKIDLSDEIEIILKELNNLLIILNVNSPEIFKQFIENWVSELDKADSVNEKLRILKLHLKETKQLQEKPGYALNPTYPDLKAQLSNWLNEEMEYHQLITTDRNTVQMAVESDGKIQTSLSVPELALLFRLFKEDKLITNPNQSEFLKVVSGCFTTVKKESFSYGHLHGKYYKIEAHTRRSVYDKLMSLVHLSRKVGQE